MSFNPNRLTTARKRRHMTKKALAAAAGVSQLTLTRLENGATLDPSPETIAQLAQSLRYPVAFFHEDDLELVEESAVSFRSLSTLSARERDAALAAASVALVFDGWVTERFDLPAPDLPDLRDERPTAAAAALRSYWGIGAQPVPNMTKLLEAKGVRVFGLCERNKSVDAYSYWRGSRPYVFLNTYKSAERSRFDAAHELAHLVLHKHNPTGARDFERDADQFAGAFLVPPADLVSHLPRSPSLRQLIVAKRRWGVSVAALARNAFDSSLLSEWGYRDICRQISAHGYRTSEPEPLKREESTVWKKVFESLWKDRLSKEHVARELKLPLDELDSFLGGVQPVQSPPTPALGGLRAVK